MEEPRDSAEESSDTEDEILETEEETDDEDAEDEQAGDSDTNADKDPLNESNENIEGEDESESDSECGDEENQSNESDSDNNERDKCCICLLKLKNQEIGVPTVCEHRFCCECITEWHKNSQTCPIDRQNFSSISVLRDDGTFLRMEDLRLPEDNYLELPPLPDDITQCEVCGLGDREDRLLLCDECNFGYHLECLNPPLQTVPLDDWFCPSCTEEHSIHPRRRISAPRAPPEIFLPPLEPESIQRSLLTRRIRQRRQKSRRKTVRRRKTTTKRKTTSKRKTTTKRKPKSKAKTRATKVKRGGRRRKIKKGRRKIKRKVAVQEKPLTSRDRLVNQLGILPPKPGQIYLGLPVCKTASQPSTSSAAMNALNHHKFRSGISTLRLYSHYEDLADCLEAESDDEQLEGEGSVGLIRPARHRNPRLSSKQGMGASIMNQTTGTDLLSQIMSSQQTLLMDRNIRIGRDGVLIPSIDPIGSANDINPNSEPQGRTPSTVFDPPNDRIRQAPLNNSEATSNSDHHSRYNNANSTNKGQHGSSSSHTENESVNSSISNSYGNENDERDGMIAPLGAGPSAHYIEPDQKSNSNNSRKDETNSTTREDDEDFNIYGDIQENNSTDATDPAATDPAATDPAATISDQAELCSGDVPNDSDSEMIIDEASNIRRGSSDSKSTNQGENKIIAADHVALPPFVDSDDSPSPGMPEADSPESIPLPDSTPPPSVPMPSEPEDNDLDEIQGGSVLYSPSDDEESGRQVYDPSQPLTSSDEEEHNERQQQPSKAVPKEPVRNNQQQSSSRSTESPKDVSAIPVPADEHRRPTIQFSIPTRHKLIPISSLIKRQRGVVRKESTGTANNQFDTSKLFGDEKDAVDGASTSSIDKPSLVSEIFGSDDDEDNKEITGESVVQEPAPSEVAEKSTRNDTLGEKSENVQSTKWKRVEDTPMTPTVDVTGITTSIPGNIPENDNIGVADSVASTDDGINLDQSKSGGVTRKPSFLELVSDGSDDEITIISATRNEDHNPDIIFLSSEKSSTNSKDSTTMDGTRERKDSDKRSRKDKDERRPRSQKRRRSSSLSNYEEGEIPSLDKKKKKAKKNKKLKKRKRSKDSSSSPRANVGERQPEIDQNINSSSDEGRNVSWRKPSKSTKERNYRDGKPKTEDKYFREKDKADRASQERKAGREKSPYHRSRDRRGSKIESKRSHRRSTSRNKASPIRWSRSRSTSKNRNRGKPDRYRSRSISSRESFSPRRSNHSRSRHLGHPLSTRNERSRSKSRTPRLRSRSPNSDRHRHRRKSHSNQRRSGRAGSSSDSRSRSRSRERRRHEKLDSTEKSKKAGLKKDKTAKENVEAAMPEEEMKEKKKKRKRREKSISPAKAVFADGDSIVISLNFQKPKEVSKDLADESSEHIQNAEPTEKKKKRNSSRDATNSGKSKPLKKTVLIDLETSPIQEQKIGESPTLVVLSDEEDENRSKSTRKGKDMHQNDKEHDGVTRVTTSGSGVDDLVSPNLQHGKCVQADSTQIHQTEASKLKDSIFGHECTNSPARGDSMVTSTRDSIEGTAQTEDDSRSRSSSPKPPEPQAIRNDSPTAKTPPIPESPLSRHLDGMRNDSFRATPTSNAPLTSTGNTNTAALPNATSTSGQGLTRPLGIGNIPGLFPSSSLTGIPVPPSSVVIPTPPQPQLRFTTTSAMNPSINILASVANALYGPLMAARQMPSLSKPISTTTSSNQRVTSQPNILLPKNHNSHSHGRRPGDGGDSPFSPNSSDGDDLFEPPMEKRTPQNLKDNLSGSSNSIGHKPEKTDRPTVPNPPIIGAPASAINAKSKNVLFDTLFGSPSKKTPTQASSAHHSKAHVKIKPKTNESSKSKGAVKLDPHKQLSEGELRQTEDVPTSAVELRVKEKYLKKLNRQERVVEEVKMALKPHYGKKSINKDDYKEILRRAVPKICHTKSGEINPFKIKELVEAYVKKFRHSKGK